MADATLGPRKHPELAAWFEAQSRSTQNAVLSLQTDLLAAGFGEGQDFVALAAWTEACRQIRATASRHLRVNAQMPTRSELNNAEETFLEEDYFGEKPVVPPPRFRPRRPPPGET